VFDAAQVATNGLAIGMDISFSKVARAQRIVKRDAPLTYWLGEQFGLSKFKSQPICAQYTFCSWERNGIRLPDELGGLRRCLLRLRSVMTRKQVLREIFRA